MPYLGNTTGNRFVASKAATQFSGDGSTTAFTLEHSVGSDEDILVSVDGVIQEPSVAYAVSNGTTLTFTAAPSNNSGNNIFVYYLFRTVATVDHPSTSALTATSGTFTSDLTVDTNTLKVDSTNNRVGIGTASPSTSLNVVGGEYLQTQDSADAVLTLTSTSNSGRSYQIRSQNSSGEFYVYDNTAGASRITVDSNGHVTMPSQPAFLVQSSGQTNLSTNATTTITFGTPVFDQNSDFDTSTEKFTAPVTGKYQFNISLRVDQVDNTSQYTTVRLVTSNRTIYGIYTNNGFDADLDYITYGFSHLMDMDAGDTANIAIYLPSLGVAMLDVTDAGFWSGYLVC